VVRTVSGSVQTVESAVASKDAQALVDLTERLELEVSIADRRTNAQRPPTDTLHQSAMDGSVPKYALQLLAYLLNNDL
jgi:hypothetical protein